MIAVIEYNAGNITSVKNAVERLGYECIITNEYEKILEANHVIFPGVGQAKSAMKYIKEKQLDVLITSLTQPVLGICLGQQLLCQFSEEGSTECLGVFEGVVKRFPPTHIVPHMGWNNIRTLQSEHLFSGITENTDLYFIHSYYCELSAHTIAESDYILRFSAAMKKNNFYATQFHPEKSSFIGEKILQNFLLL